MQSALKLMSGLVLAILMMPATAHEFLENGIFIDHPWARPTPPVQPINSAVYLVIENRTDADIRLTGAATPLGENVSIHRTEETDGMMTMKSVKGGVPVNAGDVVPFEPGGYHIMLKELEKPLKRGSSFPLELTFDNGQTMEVTVNVDDEGMTDESSHHHHHH